MDLFISLLITLFLLFAIVWACSVFTNAIEWLGHRFNLSEGAVGSVLAAVGTALPETLIPVVALVGGAMSGTAMDSETAGHIGVGAILGAPFLLSTLAMALAGASVFYFAAMQKRGVVLHVDLHLFKRDLNYFFPAYGLVFVASLIDLPPLKWVICGLLLGLYVFYVYRTLKIEHIPDEEFHLDPLMFASKKREPATGIILLQTLAGLAGIVILAHLFVERIHHLSTELGISALLLSLIIAPIATELPEKYNSVTWIGKKKDNLALGNITGAMVFQSCIPPIIGILFTPWILDEQGRLSVLLCFASAGIIYAYIQRKRILRPQILLVGGLFYLIFLFYSVAKVVQG